MIGILALLFNTLIALPVMAQNTAPIWLEETLHGTGKLNTVAAVVGIILLGLGIWMFTLDRKLTKLEAKLNKHPQ